MTSPFYNKIVWITGASTGIGKSLVYAFHKAGAKVALSARSEDKLQLIQEDLGKDRILILPMDVTHSEDYKEILKAIHRKWGGLHYAILNAGTCFYVEPGQFQGEVFEKTMDVNFMSMVYGIEALLTHWQEQPGHVVMVGSIAGYGGLPRSAAYGASKAAVRCLAQSLQVDYLGSNKVFSLVSPGFVKTPMTDQNDFPMPFMISSDKAATHILKGIAQKKLEIFFPFFFCVALKFITSLPASWSRRLIAVAKKHRRS